MASLLQWDATSIYYFQNCDFLEHSFSGLGYAISCGRVQAHSLVGLGSDSRKARGETESALVEGKIELELTRPVSSVALEPARTALSLIEWAISAPSTSKASSPQPHLLLSPQGIVSRY